MRYGYAMLDKHERLLFWVFDHAMDEGSRGIFQEGFQDFGTRVTHAYWNNLFRFFDLMISATC